MYSLFIIIFAAFAISTPTPTNKSLLPRSKVAFPGPIPYQDPKQGSPNPQSVMSNIKHFGLKTPFDEMKACLVAYGSDQFFESWDGNVCGGVGWFKGSNNDKISAYDCYQTCASWLEGDALNNKAKDYQCDFEKGTKGHCWMGYHPVSAPASTPAANSTNPVEVA